MTRGKKELGIIVCLFLFVVIIASSSYGWGVEVWAKDPTGSYPVVLASSNWVLVGSAFGENFESNYSGKETLEALLLDSIGQLYPSAPPKVAVYAGGDSQDINGLQSVMNNFVSGGYIDSFDLVHVTPASPLDVDFATLMNYDVVVLDAPTCKGPSWQFIVTEESKEALSQYLQEGGKLVASAYLFVDWYAYTSWGRELYNTDLSERLLQGALPDITTYAASAMTNVPLTEGDVIMTLNAASPGLSQPYDPYFHFFWKLELPVVQALVRIEPETINLRSKGDFTAFIELPEGYYVSEIDIDSVACQGAKAIRWNIANDTLIVKFDREELVDVVPGDHVALTVTGSLTSGIPFQASDTVRIK